MDNIHDEVARRVDNIKGEQERKKRLHIGFRRPSEISPELKKVQRNLEFSKKVFEKPLKRKVHNKEVFGFVTVDPSIEVYGHNHWDRNIYTTDELIDLSVNVKFEQLKKYVGKKHQTGGKFWFVVVLMIAGMVSIVVLLMLFSGMGWI